MLRHGPGPGHQLFHPSAPIHCEKCLGLAPAVESIDGSVATLCSTRGGGSVGLALKETKDLGLRRLCVLKPKVFLGHVALGIQLMLVPLAELVLLACDTLTDVE